MKINAFSFLLILLTPMLGVGQDCFDPGGDCTLSNPTEFQITIDVTCGDTVRLDPTQELCNTWIIPENVNFNYGIDDDSLVVFLIVDQCYPTPLIVDGITNTPSGSGIASCDTRLVYNLPPALDTMPRGLNCSEYMALDSLDLMLQSSCGCDSLLLEFFLEEIIDTTYLTLPTCNPNETGTTVDTLMASTGCDSILITTTELNELPELFLEDQYVCEGVDAVLQAYALNEGTYVWDDGTTGYELEVSTPGTYTVTFTDENGCSISQSADVFYSDIGVALEATVADPLLLSLNPLEVWQGSAIEMKVIVSETPFSYDIVWNGGPQIGDSIFNYIATSSGPFQVGVIDSVGCSGSASIDVLVRPIKVYVPTAFSPNGDNTNDLFSIYTSPNVEEMRLQLFSRGGGTVFNERLTPTQFLPQGIVWEAWDGTYRGKRLNPQVFAFQLWYRAIQGEWKNISGDLTLVK